MTKKETIYLFRQIGKRLIKTCEGSDLKVLLYLISKKSDVIECGQYEIEDGTGISKRSIQMAIRKLKKLNVISVSPSPEDGRRNVYKINSVEKWK